LQKPLSPDAKADADKLVRIASHFLSAGRATVFDTWSIVEADLTVTLSRLVANSDPVPSALARYTAEQWKRPSLAAFKHHPRS
jgi:glutathione S-transferase